MKRKKNILIYYKKISLLIGILIFSFAFNSKAEEIDINVMQLPKKYTFPDGTENKITDEYQTLFPFWEMLRNDSAGKQTVQIITHIGDSHIQADFETSVLRRLFQSTFGNAGRGVIAPYRLAKTNEPLNYKIFSTEEWNGRRCVTQGCLPVGLTGLVVQNMDSLTEINIENKDNDPLFNEVILYYDTDKSYSLLADTGLLDKNEILSPFSERLLLKNPVSGLNFQFFSEELKDTRFYGMDLRNGNSGVLYNAIGINGAHYYDYTSDTLFFRQLSILQSDLYIISLGTNEAYAKQFSKEKFVSEIDRMIQSIREMSPQAMIVLTTPAEGWIRTRVKKKRVRTTNSMVEKISKTIVDYAKENRIAYWDLYTITGGTGSAKAWSKNGLYAKDGIHFTREGYEYQGELLFEALYNEYLKTCSISKK